MFWNDAILDFLAQPAERCRRLTGSTAPHKDCSVDFIALAFLRLPVHLALFAMSSRDVVHEPATYEDFVCNHYFRPVVLYDDGTSQERVIEHKERHGILTDVFFH